MKNSNLLQTDNKLVEPIQASKAYCGACQEDPCMCSDPEQTSTTLDW